MIGQQFSSDRSGTHKAKYGHKIVLFLISYLVALIHISAGLTHKAQLSLYEDGFEDFEVNVEHDEDSDYQFAGSRYDNLTEGTEGGRGPLEGYWNDEDTSTCGCSDEAKRVNLQQFLQKVQDKFFELRPQELVYKSGVPITEFRQKFRLYDPSPDHIRLETEESGKLWSELKKMSADFNKLKPREQKAFKQTEHFLQHVFATSFHGNYYSGDFLLGPDYFCWQPISDTRYNIYYGLRRFQPSCEKEVVKLFEMVKNMFDQYQLNMRFGVKVGMVNSIEVCRAGLDALKREYLEIALKGPEGVFSEWWAKPLLSYRFTSKLGTFLIPRVRQLMLEYIGTPIHNLLRYLKDEHIRHCVPSEVSSGLASLPVDVVYVDGKPTSEATTKRLPCGAPLAGRHAYKYLLSYFATKEITPDEVYELGYKKLREIYPQAIKIAQEVTGETDPEVARRLFVKKINEPEMFFATDIPETESDANAQKQCSDKAGAQKHCPKRWAAMQKWFTLAREAISMLEGKIGNLFHNSASNPKRTSPACGVDLSPDFNPSSAAASYVSSDKSCSSPAKYYLPFFMDKPGPTYEEWTTNAHEARPGHHYQLQGKEEFFKDNCNDVISWVETVTSDAFTAYAEGWALYAESPLIAKDTDTYDGQPLYKYGMLKLQIWRALRLIVDAGIHYKGMKRSEAVELFKKYAWDDSDKALKEITRYQGAPGQATAYMIGQLQFKKARDFVQRALGKNFNLKDFHFYLLVTGDIPLGYMNDRMKSYAWCVLKPSDVGCSYLLNPPRNTDVVHDSLQEMEIVDREMLKDDIWATPKRHVRPIPV